MKSTNLKLALIGVALCGVLAACKPAPVEVPAPVAEPAPVTPAPEPVISTDPAAMPAPATDMAPAAPAEEENEDSPHSGGDKVRPAASN